MAEQTSQPIAVASRLSRGQSALLLTGIVLGLFGGIYGVESYVYAVLSYNAVPAALRPSAPTLLLGVAVAIGLAGLFIGRIDGEAVVRAAWPLVFAAPLGALPFLPISMGFLPLYLLTGLLLIVGTRLARRWSPATLPTLSAPWAWAAIGLVAIAFILYTWHYQNRMASRFLLGYSDVGWYLDRLHNTVVHGDYLRQYSDRPTYYDHFCPGLGMLVPFYALWPDPRLLNLVQSLAIGGTGLLLFALARRRGLAPLPALGVGLLYYAFPAASMITYAYSYGFHPPSIALPLLILAFYLLDRRRYLLAILPALAAISLQEHIPIYFVGLGGAMILQRRWRAGVVVAGLAAIYFLYVFVIFMPQHVQGQNVHVGQLFGHLGGSIGGIALSPVLRPEAFFGALVNGRNLQLLLILSLPLGGLWMLAPRFVIALVPVILFNLLRLDPQAGSIAFHYQTGTVGILFLAMALGYAERQEPPVEAVIPLVGRPLAALIGRLRVIGPGAVLCGALIACGLLTFYLSLYPWSRRNMGILPDAPVQRAYARAYVDLQRLVPKNASVTADDRTLMALHDRAFARLYDPAGGPATDYYAFLFGSWMAPPRETDRIVDSLLQSGDFEVIYRQNYLVVLRRKQPLPAPPTDHY